MKSILSKIAITGLVAICLSSTLQAKPVTPALTDTSKMSKMKKADKMEAKKMDKMSDKKMTSKMKKDTGKMSKM